MAKVSPRFPMQFARPELSFSYLSLSLSLSLSHPLISSSPIQTSVGNFSSLMRSYAISAKTFLTLRSFWPIQQPKLVNNSRQLQPSSPPHRSQSSTVADRASPSTLIPFIRLLSHCRRHVVLWFGLSLFRVFCQISSAPRFILSFRAFRLCKAIPKPASPDCSPLQ